MECIPNISAALEDTVIESDEALVMFDAYDQGRDVVGGVSG